MTRLASAGPARPVLLLAALLPLLALTVLVAQRAANVPTWDEWDVPAETLLADREGTLSWRHLWSQHNESRKVVPRLVFVALARVGGWDTRHGMALAVVVASALSVGLLLLARRTVPWPTEGILALWALTNVVVFSPLQLDNWLLGLGWIAFVPAACLVWAILALQGHGASPRRLAVAALLALAATFSFSAGLLLWPILGLAVALEAARSPGRRARWAPLAAWTAVAAIVIAAYFRDYHRPEHHPNLADSLAAGSGTVRVLAAYSGSSLAFANVSAAQVLGALTLSLFLVLGARAVSRRHESQTSGRSAPWVLLGLLSVGEGLLIALGRSSFGVQEAISSRYTTHAAILVIAVIHLVAVVFSSASAQRSPGSSRGRRATMAAGALCVLALSTAGFLVGARAMANHQRDRWEGMACLRVLDLAPDRACLEARVYPSLAVLTTKIAALEDAGVIDPIVARTEADVLVADSSSETGPKGGLEHLRRGADDSIVASGWARSGSNRPADAILVVARCADGGRTILASGRVGDRSLSHLEAIGAVADANDRWRVEIAAESLPSCAYELEPWALDVDSGRARRLAVP